MAVDQQKKRAMKRLLSDLEEIRKFPINNVSAEPLDENMLEWHCNFKQNDIVYHLILFFTDNYPYESPSAEFVPPGMRYKGMFATRQGRVGTQICLNIFSDFENYHREWRHQQGLGWSPGYSVQTILLNVISFINESQPKPGWWFSQDDSLKVNISLSKKFTCEDCGHTYYKPYPPLLNTPVPGQTDTSTEKMQIVDYMTKEKFKVSKPKFTDELFGYGLILSGPKTRRSMTTPCEFLTSGSFHSMKDVVGTVHSTAKAQLSYFLPMYIHPLHGNEIKASIEKSMYEAVKVLPKCSPGKTPAGKALMHMIPNLMSATVVEFSKGTQHTSDNSLHGYFALHRLFLWAIETYPEIQKMINDKLEVFIKDDTKRTKYRFPHLGEWLMLLSGSSEYRWKDAATAYLDESWRRNVMWYVKDDKKLGFLDTDKCYRLQHTLKRTEVSRKLLAFQVIFLDIAMPDGMSRSDIIKRYDGNLGFPTDEMIEKMKEGLKRVNSMKTYADWFNILRLEKPSDEEIFQRLIRSLKFAIRTNGYHWTSYNEGGWRDVLNRYKPGGAKTPTFDVEGYDSTQDGGVVGITSDGENKNRKRHAEDQLEDEGQLNLKRRLTDYIYGTCTIL